MSLTGIIFGFGLCVVVVAVVTAMDRRRAVASPHRSPVVPPREAEPLRDATRAWSDVRRAGAAAQRPASIDEATWNKMLDRRPDVANLN